MGSLALWSGIVRSRNEVEDPLVGSAVDRQGIVKMACISFNGPSRCQQGMSPAAFRGASVGLCDLVRQRLGRRARGVPQASLGMLRCVGPPTAVIS